MDIGGTKDTTVIAKQLFQPYFRMFDSKNKLIDIIVFDGASTVQKLVGHFMKFILDIQSFMAENM